MNAKGRAALASAVMLVTLFAGSANVIRGLQPGFEDFETRWPPDKAFLSNCPFASCSTVKAVPRRGIPIIAKDRTAQCTERECMVTVSTGPTKGRLIIPSYTCPPRQGETGGCLSE
jgi:hypothetical protein